MTGSDSFRPSVFARRAAAFAIFAGASSLGLHAQQSPSEVPAPAKLVADVSARPLDLASMAGVNYSASSSESSSLNAVDPAEAERLNLSLDSTQPPPRRRYGRPRYNDSSHNPDGSSKYAFVVGAGMTAPNGNTYKYLNTNYAFQLGAGRNFNKNVGLMLQFDYDRFGFNGQTLYNQATLYNYYCPPSQVALGNCARITSLDGNSHVWSFSVNPIFNLYSSEGLGAYFVVGAGFFHKTANFTVPTTGTYCDYYYGCYQYQANQTIDKYTSNAPGFSGGFGLTFKPSRFANERLFAEGRYVFVDNSKRTGVTVNSSTAALNNPGNNFYPANSNRTSYSVFKAGVRF